jgi:hypothetical protein
MPLFIQSVSDTCWATSSSPHLEQPGSGVNPFVTSITAADFASPWPPASLTIS